MRSILIGCDPEVFLKKGDEVVSAHGIIPGTKTAPYPVEYGAVQVDGLALEFNIDPVSTLNDFVNSNTRVMKTLQSMLPEGHDILIEPACNFEADYISTLPEESLELGCDEDYNAYTGNANPPPNASSNMRTAAGHIHIGWLGHSEYTDPMSEEHYQTCRVVTKMLDYNLYRAYRTTFGLTKDEVKRQEMYGSVGTFRPKPYGVEYRVLSNSWLKDSERMAFVYNRVQETMRQIQRDYSGCDLSSYLTSPISV